MLPLIRRLAALLSACLPATLAAQPAVPVERPPFLQLVEQAKLRFVIQAETREGRTAVLVTAMEDHPRLLFVYAPGGEGRLDLGSDAAGVPVSPRPRNPAFAFGPAFLERGAGFAAIGVPENFGPGLNRPLRLEKPHIEAFTQASLRLRERFPKSRLVLIGHSNGAMTAGMQAVLDAPVYDAVVFSAPQLTRMPYRWSPERARVPVLFITHRDDACRGSLAHETVAAAGGRHPLVVIEAPSPGRAEECFVAPAPHFFSGVHAQYAEALVRWAGGLPERRATTD
jgi:hypothetical protein